MPVNIVDLGSVYGVTVRDAYAHLDDAHRRRVPPADEVEDDVHRAAEGAGIETVDIDIVKEPAWSPDRMSEAARAAVGW
jgi:metal-sulfur cluster biosynthetic enzyme